METTSRAVTVHARAGGHDPWTTEILTEGETLSIPDLAIAIPIADFYEGTDIPDSLPDEADSG